MGRARARVRVFGRFDGTDGATVVITDQLFTVRPSRRRRSYTLLLADVARSVIFDVVRAELRAKKAEKKARQGGKRR